EQSGRNLIYAPWSSLMLLGHEDMPRVHGPGSRGGEIGLSHVSHAVEGFSSAMFANMLSGPASPAAGNRPTPPEIKAGSGLEGDVDHMPARFAGFLALAQLKDASMHRIVGGVLVLVLSLAVVAAEAEGQPRRMLPVIDRAVVIVQSSIHSVNQLARP